MKKKLILILCLLIIATGFNPVAIFHQMAEANDQDAQIILIENDDLKKQAFLILNTKCNVCHRKKNPFMVFSLKNMEKRATKIHKQVFIKRRMPKGKEIKLTSKEYATLEKWLHTLNIY